MTALKRDRSPLEARAQRIISIERERFRHQEARYREVLTAITSASCPDYVRTLARVAVCGTDQGTMGWYFTSRILKHPETSEFCVSCGAPLYGNPPLPELPCPWENIGMDCPAGEVSFTEVEEIE